MKTTTFLACALACSIRTQGGVIYDNFGPGDGFAATCSDLISMEAGDYTRLAVPFTPLAPVTLDQITVAMTQVEGPNQVLLSVCPDAEGAPSATVVDWIEVDGLLSDEGSVQTGQSTLHPRLEMGASYWVVAQAVRPSSHAMRWHCAGTFACGRAYQAIWCAGWGVDQEGTYALRVEGTVVPGTRPRLRCAAKGANVVVSWPTAFTGFVLESTADLGDRSSWSTVPVAPTVVGSELSVSEAVSVEARFYRLRSE